MGHRNEMGLMTMATPAAVEPPHPAWHRQPSLLRRLFQDPQPVLEELCDELGPIYGVGAGPVRMAVVGDPSALRELFGMSVDHFRWGHKFNVLGFVVGSGSMIVSDGPDHKRRRGAVQSAFSRRRLNRWIPTIIQRTDAAVDRLVVDLAAESDVVDMYEVGRALVLDVVVRALFGERLAARSTEIGSLFRRPQEYLESPAPKQVPHPLPFTRRSRVRADRRALDAIIDEEIARQRSHPTDDPLDVLSCLVNEGDLSDSEIRDQVVTLMGAGYDTTSATLSWMFWCIGLTEGLWSRLRSEADNVFGPLDQRPSPNEETLASLDLANRTMRETTRLHPAGVISPREAATDVSVGGRLIPAGTLILWSAHLAGRDPRAWTDPLRFDPDRFLTASPEQQALADIAWVPFGRGARNCIGFALAQMELTLIIARLAQRLDIEPISEVKPNARGMVVNRPAGGAPMRVRERQPAG